MDATTKATMQTRADGAQASEGKSDRESQLAEIRMNLAALVHALGNFGRNRSEVLAESLRESSHDALTDLGPLLQNVQRRLTQAEKGIERSVRDHPGRWLGGLLGVVGFGILIGLMFGRRN